ncbi:unnamed protein product [Ilex paraguariensis]|uniref:Uncharacterized protein n=1 Tax=Ilex paraguariensis TaxID=185542 RepID=A0ABC8SDN9_9AQUA
MTIDMLINDINMNPKGAEKPIVAMKTLGAGHKNKVTKTQDKKQERKWRLLKTRRFKVHKEIYEKKRFRKGKEMMVLLKKLRNSNGNEDREVQVRPSSLENHMHLQSQDSTVH